MERRTLLIATVAILGTGATAMLSRSVLTNAKPESSTPSLLLKKEHGATLAQISEQIIPVTDTPGAIEAGVPEFIQHIFSNWYRPDERQQFLNGLNEFQALALKQKKATFVDCSDEAKLELLIFAEGAGDNPSLQDFIATIKALTVRGYYTSEVGAKQELIYNPVPLKYKGDYLFSDVGRQWSY